MAGELGVDFRFEENVKEIKIEKGLARRVNTR